MHIKGGIPAYLFTEKTVAASSGSNVAMLYKQKDTPYIALYLDKLRVVSFTTLIKGRKSILFTPSLFQFYHEALSFCHYRRHVGYAECRWCYPYPLLGPG